MNQVIEYHHQGRELVPVVVKKPGRFKKGNIPWNTGKKGNCYMGESSTRFKKGNISPNYQPVGTTRINKHGCIEVKYADRNKWKSLALAMWETINGPLPEGMFLRCKTDDKTNVLPSNWEPITRKENLLRNLNRKKAQESMKKTWKREFIRLNIGLPPATGLGVLLQNRAV